jgi:hypothetical protein
MQRQLLDQRLAQFGVVIDNQDCAFIGHRPKAPSKDAARPLLQSRNRTFRAKRASKN